MKNLQSFESFSLNEQEDLNPDKLKFGDKDKDANGPVHKLQQRLIDKGLIAITKPTGYFGEMTKKALEEANKKWDAILVGGLDTRPGDYNIDQQVKMLKKSLGESPRLCLEQCPDQQTHS